jgi:M6 family metalloprotease-like protein
VIGLLAVLAVVAVVVLPVRSTDAGSERSATASCAPPVLGRGVGEGRNDPVHFPPTVGELPAAMLFADFADARGTSDPSAVFGSVMPRVSAWYGTVSYGRMRLDVTPLRRWLPLAGRVRDYAANPDEGLRRAIDEAVALADAEVDFSRYRALYLVIPGAAFEEIGGIGVLIAERPIRADGASIHALAWLHDELENREAYVIHETGHLLGLPDLYVLRALRTFHRWDVMAWGEGTKPGGMFAWHRWKLGWLDPRQIACYSGRRTLRATVSPVERPGGVKAVVFRTPRVAYVAEVRQRLAEDAEICKPGVLIYIVDFFAATGSNDIRLLEARPERTLPSRCGRQAAAPFGTGRRDVSSIAVGGLRIEVRAALPDGSYRIAVRRSRP